MNDINNSPSISIEQILKARKALDDAHVPLGTKENPRHLYDPITGDWYQVYFDEDGKQVMELVIYSAGR